MPVIMTFLSNSGFFLVWPLTATFINQHYDLSQMTVGFLMALLPLTSFLCSFLFTSKISTTRYEIGFILSSALLVINSSLLFNNNNIVIFSLSIVLLGISHSLISMFSKLTISAYKNENKRKKYFGHLFYATNVSAFSSPLIIFLSSELDFNYTKNIILLLGLTMLTLAMVNLVFGKHLKIEKSKETSMIDSFNCLKKDRFLRLIVLLNILITMVYSFIDTPLINTLIDLKIQEPEKLFSLILSTAAIFILVLYYPIQSMIKNLNTTLKMAYGCVLLLISQIAFHFCLHYNPDQYIYIYIIPSIIMSIAECIIFSSTNPQILELSPNDERGAYLGASSLYSSGTFLAPIMGALIITNLGSNYVFISTSIITIIVAYAYYFIYSNKIVSSQTKKVF